MEKGSIILIGATTENPSFEVNGALLSRCKVFVLQSLKTEELVSLLRHALTDERGFGGQKIEIADDLLEAIANFANGDARSALSTLEMAVLNGEADGDAVRVTRESIEQITSKKSLLYDKTGEEHYNLISALHKSMRNSDPDAAVYWLARMLEAGRILSTSPGASPVSPPRTSASPTRARWNWPSPPTRPAIGSGCPNAASTSPKRSSISPSPPNPTPPTSPTSAPKRTR